MNVGPTIGIAVGVPAENLIANDLGEAGDGVAHIGEECRFCPVRLFQVAFGEMEFGIRLPYIFAFVLECHSVPHAPRDFAIAVSEGALIVRPQT
jgi:hypothetical protein